MKEETNVEISSDVEFFDDTDIGDLMESSNDLAEINNVSHETSQELSKLTKNNKKSIAAEIKIETENGQESIQCYYCSQVCKLH